jgi:predicted N-formylglutamate amidohydrolase
MRGEAVEQQLSGLRQEQTWAPFRRLAGDTGSGVLLLCDHAENSIPPAYGTLGLTEEDRGRHIAYDIGAAGVTEHLSRALDAPALLTRYSRLLIDPNRGRDDPTLIMQISDGRVVPGNAVLEAGEIESRIAQFYLPYHEAIDAAIDEGIAAGKPPVLLAIHSFTQAWKSVPRPWHVAVLWDKDPRLAGALLRELAAISDVTVGDNVPYSGQLKGDTLYQHGTLRGLAHALIEIRQDLVLSPEGQAEWGERLASVVRKVIASAEFGPRLHAVEHYGSHTDRQTQGSG